MNDLLIRGGVVVTPDGAAVADVLINGEQIVSIGQSLTATPSCEEVDARGLAVLPAVVDVHVHFNEPGREDWEGVATGSRALARGGGSTCFDMPLNSTPCAVTVEACARKREAFEAASSVDFGLWGGLVPGHLDDLEPMAAFGVVGFKAFMCDSGLAEFPAADLDTLRAGMRVARALGLPVAVHAESEIVLRSHAASRTRTDARAFLESRPVLAETTAIRDALEAAEETGAALHIVHISSGAGVRLAADARARGVNVSIETCPHYLALNEMDVEALGVIAKCAPPLRPESVRQELWETLAQGHVDIVASDHSPAPPSLKVAGDFRSSWGGIAGVQSTLAVLLDQGVAERALPLTRIASLVAEMPSRRFRIARKGVLAPGYDADLVLVDLADRTRLSPDDLEQRHRVSPYVGRQFRGSVRRTLRRGETIFTDGRITATRGGRFVRPLLG